MKANLTNNEIQVLKAAVEIARKVGDNGVEFFMSDVAAEVNKSQKEVQGICSSLQNKGMIECFDGHYFLKNADGDTKAVKMDSLESMLKKFNFSTSTFLI